MKSVVIWRSLGGKGFNQLLALFIIHVENEVSNKRSKPNNSAYPRKVVKKQREGAANTAA